MEFIDEIRQQPDALRNFTGYYFKEGKVEELLNYLGCLSFDRIVITGMGSSYFAALTGAMFLRNSGFNAYAFESGELVNNDKEAICNKGTLLIVISQTGKSLEVLELARIVNKTVPTIIISNHSDRELVKYANYFVDILAGVEKFTSSKTYTNTLAAVLMVSDLIISKKNNNNLPKILSDVCVKMEELLLQHDIINQACEMVKDINNVFFIGSGYSYFTATHAELVSGEVAKIFGSRYTTGQFLHGPVEMMKGGMGYFIFDNNCATRNNAEKIINMALKSEGTVIHLSDKDYETENERYLNIPVPFIKEEIMPLIEVIPLELLINDIAKNRGYNPGVLEFVKK